MKDCFDKMEAEQVGGDDRFVVGAGGCASVAWVTMSVAVTFAESVAPAAYVLIVLSGIFAIAGEAFGVIYFAKHRGTKYESVLILLAMLFGLIPLHVLFAFCFSLLE